MKNTNKNLWLGVAGVIFTVFLASCVSVKKADPEMLKYSEIVSVSDTNKDELFAKVNLWMINALKEEESRIQRSDGAAGVITATHTYWTIWGSKSYPMRTLVLTTVAVNVNDNGYTLNFSDPIFKCRVPVGPSTPNGWTRTERLDGTLVEATRAAWFDLGGGLRSTVSGTLVGN
jgi:hypothetical protein